MNLPERCDKYSINKPLMVEHSIQLKVGGMLMGRHSKVRNYLALMAIHDFTTIYYHNKPILYSSRYITVTRQLDVAINATSEHAERLRGDIQIRHLWQHQTDTVIDVIAIYKDDKLTYLAHLTMLQKLNRREIK